jgi:hypothetical protein
MAAKSTKELLGHDPLAFDPALANPRQRRKIIYDAKKESAPCGTGLEGNYFMAN